MTHLQTLRSRLAAAVAPGAMILGILALYCPPRLFRDGGTLAGFDYLNLHARRIRYVQEALFGGHPRLPAWHTLELMGAPFWSNVQSFPFLPTRLLLLPLDADILYPVAVSLAAILAALFTYLYCRRLGLQRLASAAAGWTFAASGFFACRVLVGHLPLLEAFVALPLLLWSLERIAQSDPQGRRVGFEHLGLALATFCVVLAGHPQVPAYAVGAAGLYAVVRLWGRRALRALVAMSAGVGLAGFAWWPMLRLIGRSTRMLALERAANDVPFPFWRLKGFVMPWADGWPPLVARYPARDFVVSNSPPYFWDTVCYVGVLPLVAVLVLSGRMIWKRRMPAVPWQLLAVVSCGALLLALPVLPAGGAAGATLLRSSSRLIYVTTFGLAVAMGAFVDLLLRTGSSRGRLLAYGLAGIALLVHAVDLASHDRHFVVRIDRPPERPGQMESWRKMVADGRVAFDHDAFPANRGIDDVGFFDSIVLARPYRAILAMQGDPASSNVQRFDGASLPPEALAGLCVHLVFTRTGRKDLPLLSAERDARSSTAGSGTLLAVPDPAPRAAFVPDALAGFLDEEAILDRYRREGFDPRRGILLSPSARPAHLGIRAASGSGAPVLRYSRPDSDHVVVGIRTEESGYVRVVESWDEGWRATLDGAPTEILLADAFAMAVRVPPGDHEIRLVYETPRAGAGLAVSALSAALLAFFSLLPHRGRGKSP